MRRRARPRQGGNLSDLGRRRRIAARSAGSCRPGCDAGPITFAFRGTAKSTLSREWRAMIGIQITVSADSGLAMAVRYPLNGLPGARAAHRNQSQITGITGSTGGARRLTVMMDQQNFEATRPVSADPAVALAEALGQLPKAPAQGPRRQNRSLAPRRRSKTSPRNSASSSATRTN